MNIEIVYEINHVKKYNVIVCGLTRNQMSKYVVNHSLYFKLRFNQMGIC